MSPTYTANVARVVSQWGYELSWVRNVLGTSCLVTSLLPSESATSNMIGQTRLIRRQNCSIKVDAHLLN